MASGIRATTESSPSRRSIVKRWADRSRVEATLLNPALIALLMGEASREYERHSGAMTWPVAFLVPPLVLHRPTRDALPRDTRTHLSTWISRQPVLRAGFPERAAAMVPLTREGLRFGLRHGLITTADGGIRGTATRTAPPGDLRVLVGKAGLVGRWLAKTEQPSTVFALLGVRP
jgi:hypothetical protein